MIRFLGVAALWSFAACTTFGGVIDFSDLQPLASGTSITAGAIDQADLAVGFRTLNSDFTQYSQVAGFWNAGYSDLDAAVYSETIGRILEITLTPIGYAGVTFHSFYLGSYTPTITHTSTVFRVTDGEGNTLWDDEPHLHGIGSTASLIEVGVTAPVLKLYIGTDWHMGVNLLSYTASDELPGTGEIPEPSTCALVGAGLALALWRRRHA